MLRGSVLLLLLCPAAALAEGESYRGAVGGQLGGSYQRQGSYTGVTGDAGLSLLLRPGRRLFDDGEPLSLQPFLQRTNDLGLSVNGAYSWSARDGAASSQGAYFGASVGGGAWIGAVYLGAAVAGERYLDIPSYLGPGTPTTQPLNLISPRLTLQVAMGRLRLLAGYRLRLRFLDSQIIPPSWGAIDLGLRWVTSGHGSLWAVQFFNLDGWGFGGLGSVEAFFGQRIGLLVSLELLTGSFYVNTDVHFLRAVLTAGAAIWLTRRVELLPSLSVINTRRDQLGYDGVWSASATVSLSCRF